MTLPVSWGHFRTKLTNAVRELEREVEDRRAQYVDLTEIRRDLIAEAEYQAVLNRESRVLRVSSSRRRA